MFKKVLLLISLCFWVVSAKSQQVQLGTDSLQKIIQYDSLDSVALGLVKVTDTVTPKFLKPLDSTAIANIADSLSKGLGYPVLDFEVLNKNFRLSSIKKNVLQPGLALPKGEMWVLIVVGLLLVLFAVLKRSFSKQLSAIIQAFFSNRALVNLNKEDNLFTSWPFLLLFIQFGFTIGMFFDGTGNNRFNSEKVYYKKLNSSKLVYSRIPKEKKLEDGSIIQNDSSYWNPYSNVALLYDLYDEKKYSDKEKKVTLKLYIQGIGTQEGKEDEILGSALGEGENGIIGKVAEGCKELAEEIKKVLGNDNEIGSVTFDVFGFSRGAAAARHFCNEIIGKENIKDIFTKSDSNSDSSQKNQGNTRVKNNLRFIPIGKKYTLGLLGLALKDIRSQYEISELFTETTKVNIRFLGIFDTVVSQMLIKNHFGKKFRL